MDVYTHLHYAARWGYLDKVKEQVSSRADLGATDRNGWTPLMTAVKAGIKDAGAFLANVPCNITIAVVGHHGVGKSCFVRQLQQEKILESGPGSTDTADLYVNFFEYNPNTGLRQKLGEDGEIKTGRRRLKRIIDQDAQPSGKTPQQLQDNSVAAAMPTMDTSVSVLWRETEENQNVEISHRNLSRSEELSDEQRRVIGEVMGTNMEDWEDFELKGHVTIYDFGGEKVFYNTQHCFMSSNMVFVLLFDVAMCLDPLTAIDGFGNLLTLYPLQ
ncbi:uncharacterized protein LOC110455902, partial [Mizuhopecten yessoensis]|uniref:uncharacterized protein LOC110455902 n=1 Tax=Mizuhopecten yessoensis TaxID=6573 RepID=UPI000B459F65